MLLTSPELADYRTNNSFYGGHKRLPQGKSCLSLELKNEPASLRWRNWELVSWVSLTAEGAKWDKAVN